MIGIIGCGNMAQAIVKGYHQSDSRVKFLTYTPSTTRAKELAKQVNGKFTETLDDFARVETIVIACKPQQFKELAQNLSHIDLSQKHIISIMAAVSFEQIEQQLKTKKVTRVMPNTPALLGKGVSLVLHGADVNSTQRDLVQSFFSSCGLVAQMENETQFDQVTVVSGSGPAYVFYFAKTMCDQLEKWGLEPKLAKEVVINLFSGSSELMNERKELNLSELIDQVTSKGGVTIEAIKSYQQDRLDLLTQNALDKAYLRSQELKKEM